eukprot:Em0005g1319a
MHILRPSLLKSELRIFYLDDGTLGGLLSDVLRDIEMIKKEAGIVGLELNPQKSEVIGSIAAAIDTKTAMLKCLSAASSELAHLILPASMQQTQLSYVDEALVAWSQGCQKQPPTDVTAHHQKIRDSLRLSSIADTLFKNTSDHLDRVRLLAATCKESGAWLNALPISSLGLRMDDTTVRISMSLRLGLPLCRSHTCQHCGAEVSQSATHGLSCKRSAGRHYRHSAVNNIIHRALVASHVPSRLEPLGLYRSDGKRPDGYINSSLEMWPASCVGCHLPRYFCTILFHNCGTTTMESHHKCRLTDLCGCKLQRGVKAKGKPPQPEPTYQCSAYTDSLFVAFDISVSTDQEEIHPQLFCTLCHKAMLRVQVAIKSRVLRSGFVSLYDSSAPAAIPSPVFSPPSELKQPSELIIQLLGDIMVHCTYCGTDIVARAYNMHYCAFDSYEDNTATSSRQPAHAESPTVIFETELKFLDRKEKERLLKSAGITKGMTPEQGLALNADLGLPWNRLRMLRRWLKEAGVSLGAEKKQRVLSNHLVGDNLEVELTAFSFTVSGGGEEIRGAPHAFTPSLTQKVHQLLEENEQVGKLFWYDGMIPDSEIWLKFGALDRFKEEIADINGMSWRGYTMRPFICGDYEFLSGIYGLSGASGLHSWTPHNPGDFPEIAFIFEDACHRLDLQLAHLQQDGLYSTTVLDMHSKTLQELVKTREDLELAEQERDTVQQILTHSSMMYANSDEELESLKEFCRQSNENVQTLVLRLNGLMESLEKGFNDHPFVKGISTTLDAIGCPSSKVLRWDFRCLYDSCAMSQWSIVQLGNAIKDFFNTFDAMFKGARRTIKMHILEHHMLDWIRSHQVGCGLMGEQGAESIHSQFNSLAATYKTIPDPNRQA